VSISAIELNPDVVDVACDEDALHLVLADGRELSAPLAWFPRPHSASPEARADWRLIGRGQGVHWPQIGEDIAVSTLLRSR
jgi:hypothetical protein